MTRRHTTLARVRTVKFEPHHPGDPMTRPTSGPTGGPRRAATLAAVGLAVLALSGCGLVATDPAGPGPGMMRGGNGNGMMGDGSGAAMRGGGYGAGMMGGQAAGNGSTWGGPMMSGGLTCTAPAELPGSTVTVALVDMSMMGAGTDPAPLGIPMRLHTSATTVPAGQVSFVAQNMARRTHELVILPLAPGEQPGTRATGSDGEIDETGSLGEASNPCGEGAGDGLTAGTTGWVTLTLAPGRYELICNEANHYANGMWAELDVT